MNPLAAVLVSLTALPGARTINENDQKRGLPSGSDLRLLPSGPRSGARLRVRRRGVSKYSCKQAEAQPDMRGECPSVRLVNEVEPTSLFSCPLGTVTPGAIADLFYWLCLKGCVILAARD